MAEYFTEIAAEANWASAYGHAPTGGSNGECINGKLLSSCQDGLGGHRPETLIVGKSELISSIHNICWLHSSLHTVGFLFAFKASQIIESILLEFIT